MKQWSSADNSPNCRELYHKSALCFLKGSLPLCMKVNYSVRWFPPFILKSIHLIWPRSCLWILEVTLSSADKRGSLPADLININYSRINDSECASSSVIPSVRLYISLPGARFHHHRHRRSDSSCGVRRLFVPKLLKCKPLLNSTLVSSPPLSDAVL